MDTISIDRRFCGPPASGNGGYTAGCLAQYVDGVAEVRLAAPPPLEQPLTVVREGDVFELHAESGVVARATSSSVNVSPPSACSFEHAALQSQNYISPEDHYLPGCFTCGPHREPGDGLRIFSGRAEDSGTVSAPWVPHESVALEDGCVSDPVVWAALDCPGYFAHGGVDPSLLGTMAAEIHQPVRAGQRYVVVGEATGGEGRKLFSTTALFDDQGQLCAVARQIWIRLTPTPA
ncbi:MAG: hypothetical protein ACI8TX_001733 [Hyphomicrobiaceae bacterium]